MITRVSDPVIGFVVLLDGLIPQYPPVTTIQNLFFDI